MEIVPLEPARTLCGVIGDVHGDLPALVAAVDLVRAEAARRGLAPWIALLGDLVDRGPDSAGCAAFAMRLARGEDPERRDARLLFVRGDHDEALSFNAATGLFSSSVEPADWSERLNALPPDDPERAVARDYIGFVRESPAAILLRGEREGVLLAHGGVPHADLLPLLDSLEAVGAPRCDRDFAWCRVSSARRKIPNRASFLCDVGLDDVSDFLARLAELAARSQVCKFAGSQVPDSQVPDLNLELGTCKPVKGGEAAPIQHSSFSIHHFVHGHEHAAPGWVSTPLRDGTTMWTVATFHAEEDLFLPAIRPAVVLIAHAESAGPFGGGSGEAQPPPVVPHAESAESAEFCLAAAAVPAAAVPAQSAGAEPSNLRTFEPSNPTPAPLQ